MAMTSELAIVFASVFALASGLSSGLAFAFVLAFGLGFDFGLGAECVGAAALAAGIGAVCVFGG